MHYRIDEDNVVWRKIGDEIFMFNLQSGHYYSLNRTGVFVWTMLDKKKTTKEIIEKLSARYGIPQTKARADVTTLINNLKTERFINKT